MSLCALLVMANAAPEAPHEAMHEEHNETAHPPAPAPAPPVAPEPSTVIPLTSARLPGFAATLAEQMLPRGPKLWDAPPIESARAALASAVPDQRQAARWNYAHAQMTHGLVPEALGAFDVMLADDADMALVPAFRLARGVALARLNRSEQAIAMLTDPMLAVHPEACAWRMRAYEQTGSDVRALAEVPCAVHAINRRTRSDAAPFIHAASNAAINQKQYRRALRWLKLLPDRDPQANILRGRALIALGNLPSGRLRLDRVRTSGTYEQRLDAELTLVEALTAQHQIPPGEALQRTERTLFLWRGGALEERALTLAYDLASRQKNGAAILRYGGMLLRYTDTGARGRGILEQCQQQLFAILSPENGLKLPQAAGLFWDNRDLAPTGSEGDRLLNLLTDRLAQAGLYERAAELLSYQMRARAKDIEKGPVSEQVARYYLLAGYPGKALLALRESDQPAYPPAMLDARHRVEAIALYQLGKTDQAMAILEAMPDMDSLRGEMLWRRRDWQGLIAKLGDLPKGKTLSGVEQALILRHAVALAMTGNETALGDLRTRYQSAFAKLPSAAAFELLTGPVDNMTSAGISRAMAAIPSASVAGEYDALLDRQRQANDSALPITTPAQPAKIAAASMATDKPKPEAANHK